MDTRLWRCMIETAKEQDAIAKDRFREAIERSGIEYAAEWHLQEVTDARVNLTWWLRIERALGEEQAPVDAEGIDEVLKAAHYEILHGYTTRSTCPVKSFNADNARDALARWYRDVAGMLRAAMKAATAEGAK